MSDEVRTIDGVIHICLRPRMYVQHGTVAEIVAWLDGDAMNLRGGGVRTAPRNWLEFRRTVLANRDLLAMKPQDLQDLWNEWKGATKEIPSTSDAAPSSGRGLY